MEIKGKQNIAAPRQVVWDALNNPDVLKKCLPGCESVEKLDPETFAVVIRTAIGPLRARFRGKLVMTEARPPESCRMVFEGQGGTEGFGKGTSAVTLTETPEGTMLDYAAEAQVGGKLAQVGSRLIDNVAKKMADDFFAAFRKQVVPEAVPAAASEPAPEPASKPASKSAHPASASQPDRSSASKPGENTAPRSAPPPDKAAVSQAPAPAYAAAAAPSAASASMLVQRTLPTANGYPPALVPAWWLGVAACLGAAIAIAAARLI